MSKIIGTVVAICFAICAFGQSAGDEELVQFSGLIVDAEDLSAIPYANVYIPNSGQGTYSDLKGFFTIVAKKGDVVQFSYIGYKTVEAIIPDTLTSNRYSMVQLMAADTIYLPETVIFPWPSREHFTIEYLAMNTDNPLQLRAEQNLTKEKLQKLTETVSADGDENADFYLRQQTRSYIYKGQLPPQNIFSPIAWRDFIKAWKRGDFKKKKKNSK